MDAFATASRITMVHCATSAHQGMNRILRAQMLALMLASVAVGMPLLCSRRLSQSAAFVYAPEIGKVVAAKGANRNLLAPIALSVLSDITPFSNHAIAVLPDTADFLV